MNSANLDGKSAIMLPMQPYRDRIYNTRKIVKVLLEWKAGINHVDNRKRSVLHHVVMKITNDQGRLCHSMFKRKKEKKTILKVFIVVEHWH